MSIYKVWQARIASRTFTKSLCNQFAAKVVPLSEGREDTRGRRTNLTQGEAEVLVIMLKRQGGVRLTEAHTEQGLTWLRRSWAKAFGSDFPIDDVLANFSHFTYNGHEEEGRPVWRIHLTDGRMIDYFNTAWQTGAYCAGGPFARWSYVSRGKELREVNA